MGGEGEGSRKSCWLLEHDGEFVEEDLQLEEVPYVGFAELTASELRFFETSKSNVVVEQAKGTVRQELAGGQ